MKTEMTVTLTAEEATAMLVPATQQTVNADGTFGKLVDANAKDLGGLAVAVTMVFDTEAKP